MSLREKLQQGAGDGAGANRLFEAFGVLDNPFPAASQTSNNPHYPTDADEIVDTKIQSFMRDEHRSQVVVIEGTQGVGKTNLLNHYERELSELLPEYPGFYVIRYLADPESSFEGTLRRLFQELGIKHLEKLRNALRVRRDAIELARGYEMRIALNALLSETAPVDICEIMLEWLTGARVLNRHKYALHVQFRLDTVESKTAALRDLIYVSSEVNELQGIFLLLDELEKQDGVLSASLVTRYLSSMRALIDALPRHLFMMIAVTPDALRRYSNALPAFRSRLEDRITLPPLMEAEEAVALANFYLDSGRKQAAAKHGRRVDAALVPDDEIRRIFEELLESAKKRGDSGLRQREFLHRLNKRAEEIMRPSL